jgi:hypothetical protein
MPKVKVTDTNKVLEALEEGQGRATARTVDTSDIAALALYGERRLEELGLPKKFRAGATVHYSPPKVANSYNYAADGTYATITRGSSHWYVTDVHRGQTGSQSYGGRDRRSIRLTPEQQIQLINNNDLFGDVFALPNSAIDNTLRWKVRQDPKLLASLQVIQKPEEAAPVAA